LGAIQDGRVVLGGSAGSAGGVGDPPAGFWGQLRQANVTFDTAGSRPCASGSAGSDSLVDNLDRIRLGWEICDDAINEDHIDWGHAAGQVSAVDIPFQTTSGSIDATNVRDAIEETYSECYGSGGSAPLGDHDHSAAVTQGGTILRPERISDRLVICGPGCVNETLGEAITRVNALGPASSGSHWNVLILGDTTETGAVTIPQYVYASAMDEGSVVNMGANVLALSSDSELKDMVVETTMDASTKYCIDVNNASGFKLFNVRVKFAPHSSGGNVGFYFHGSSSGSAYHCVAEPTATGSAVKGFAAENTANIMLWGCEADDTVRLDDGLWIGDTTVVATKYCTFRAKAAGDDVEVNAAGATWKHLATQADPSNITMLGTSIALPQAYMSRVRASTDAGQSIANDTTTTVIFEDEGYDTHGEYNPATGEFTVKEDGYYHIHSSILYASAAGWDAGEFATLDLYVDGGPVARLAFVTAWATATVWVGCIGGTTYYLNANKVVTLRTYQNSGAAKSLWASGIHNWVSIDRLP